MFFAAVNVKNNVATSKASFRGKAVVSRVQTARTSRKSVLARAYIREYPYPEFIEEVKEAFPEKPIANVEEARVRNQSFYESKSEMSMSQGLRSRLFLGCRSFSQHWDTNTWM